jgi:hypothetical protein
MIALALTAAIVMGAPPKHILFVMVDDLVCCLHDTGVPRVAGVRTQRQIVSILKTFAPHTRKLRTHPTISMNQTHLFTCLVRMGVCLYVSGF